MELVIRGPEGSPTTIPLDKEALSLGRAADNDLAYPEDPWLSRYHLCFERHENEWIVKDCASRNGTIVNATSLKDPHRLAAGDRIYAGHLTIEVRMPGVKAPKRVVSFVTPEEEKSTREATIVTSLDQVLGKTGVPGEEQKDSTFNTARVVRALIRAGRELAGHRPLEEVFTTILELALSAVEAKRGIILTLEDDELIVRASRGERFTISTRVRDRVISERCSLMIRDAQLDAALQNQQSIVAQRVRSFMAVPLQTVDRVIGLLYVDNGTFLRAFSQEDLDLLTVMANVAAIRIEHARLALVEQSEKLMELELTQASEIQRNLLPTEAPVLEGYDLAGLNLPCRTIGGDYYDFLPYKDGRLGLVVGDVSGKGLPAALLMSSLEARVQMLVETGPDPASALTNLNRSLAVRCPVGKFVTFFYGLLDPVSGELSYSNAGHNYPLLLRANGKVEQLSESGTVLGIFPSTEYERIENKLESGDMLALFSDGVTEACTVEGTEFGEAGLAEFLQSRTSQPCATTVQDLVTHVRGWGGGSAFADDFTVVLLRRL